MAKRKYGDRATYLKVREIQSRINRLEKRGIVKSKTETARTAAIKINRYGEASPVNRAYRKALAEFHDAAIGKARIVKLTPAEARSLKASTEHLGIGHTIRNNRVQVARGQSVYRTRDKATGKVEVEIARTGLKKAPGTLVKVGPGFEHEVRAWAKRHPGKELTFELAENVNGHRSHDTFQNDEMGIRGLIFAMNQYTRGSQKTYRLMVANDKLKARESRFAKVQRERKVKRNTEAKQKSRKRHKTTRATK